MKLPVRYLLPGMVLASPIISKNKHLLLGKGVILTAKLISSIKKYGVLVADVDIIGKEFEQQDNGIDYSVSLNAVSLVEELVRGGGSVNYKKILLTVDSIIEEILEGKAVTSNLTSLCSADMYTFAHCVDVCILSIAAGALLHYDRRKLLTLGTGSLLHDIGKIKVPNWILNKPDKLTPEEFEEMKRHSCHGYQMAKQIYDIASISKEIILNHHEKYDGSGYPRGLKGNEISDMAAICSVADVYNAITTDRIYRKALPPHEAYEMIMAAGDLMFKNDVAMTFLKLIKPYPVGSAVILSNDMKGIVIDLKEELIFRPMIRIIDTNEIIDLKDHYNLVITGLLSNEEVQQLAIK
ncbi:HD-GYP domain-containing protein [Desulfotomaculum sp. 1211_IL3151]|uniref:HD-GYP domain-containing protein n=1 Tax=Desulfotomaculum sp. 1211_IL3151 TaxID=3084055 RepID=UPI002FD90E28